MKRLGGFLLTATMVFGTGCFGGFPGFDASLGFNSGASAASSGYAAPGPSYAQTNANSPFAPVGPAATNAGVLINGRLADPAQLQGMEQRYGARIPAGHYWYDARSGLAGPMGGGTLAHAPGFDFGAVPRNASNGNTGIVFNGRELPVNEALFVGNLFGVAPAVLPQFVGSYTLDATGNLYAADGRWLGNLVALAQRQGRRSYASRDNFWNSNGSSGNSQGGCSYVHINNSTDGSTTDVSSGC